VIGNNAELKRIVAERRLSARDVAGLAGVSKTRADAWLRAPGARKRGSGNSSASTVPRYRAMHDEEMERFLDALAAHVAASPHPTLSNADREPHTMNDPTSPAIDTVLIDSLRLYLENRCRPGSFLCCVLAGDLYGAAARADRRNRHALGEIARHIASTLPPEAYGSADAVESWLSVAERAAAETHR